MVKNRSVEEKGLDVFGLTRKDFFRQIIENVAIATAECFDEGGNIVVSLHREGNKMQPSNPAFDAHLQ